jgi:hypothetical protein
MKTFFASTVLAFLTISTSVNAFEVEGESFIAKFEVTSMTSSEGMSVMTSEGSVDGYGKVYLTHELTANMGSMNSGSMKGQARTMDVDGNYVAASLQGVWRRTGKEPEIISIDNLSNGTRNFAMGTYDVVTGEGQFDVYPVE